MKSIEDTLNLIDKLVHSFHKKDKLYIAQELFLSLKEIIPERFETESKTLSDCHEIEGRKSQG